MPLTDTLRGRIERDAPAVPAPLMKGAPAVIDTNVVLDIIYWQDPQAKALAAAVEAGLITPVRSMAAMLELAEVLSRPHFTGNEDEAARLTLLWCAKSVPVDEALVEKAAQEITVECRDPLDQKFFELSLAAGAKVLVSKDKLVLKAGRKMKRYGTTAFAPEETEKRLAAAL